MNKTEARFAQELEERKKIPGPEGVAHWWFETVTLRLATNRRYTPDFLVQFKSRELALYEVKGFMRDDAAVKLSVTDQYLPFRVIVVVWKSKGWHEQEIGT